MKNFTLKAKTKLELAKKIEKLFNWKKKRIGIYSIKYTNYEEIFYYFNKNEYYANFIDTKKVYDKAISLGIL